MKKLHKGFTLIETLVAITILTTAIAAALTAAGAGLQSSFYARDQITAYYLAEEAVEFIRNIRDTNFKKTNQNWTAGLEQCMDIVNYPGTPNGTLCRIHTDSNEIDVASDVNGLVLDFDPTLGYTYSTSVPSKYTRKISIQTVNSNEILITVTMQWRSGAIGGRTFVLREELFNWNPTTAL